MRLRRLILSLVLACAVLWLLEYGVPLRAMASAWLDEAVTVNGARIYLRLGELTFTFDRDLMALLGEKWEAIRAVSAQFLPPGTAESAGAVAEAIGGALEALRN